MLRKIIFDMSKTGQKILYLTDNPKQVKDQLKKKHISIKDFGPLKNDISTDHIIRVAHLLTDNMDLLGARVLCGMEPVYGITEGTLKKSGKNTLVAGERFGRGSSREQAVWALMNAGIRVVVARSFGPVFERNAAMLGLLTTNNMQVAELIATHKPVPMEEFLQGKDELTREIIKYKGLFPYLEKVNKGKAIVPEIKSRGKYRAMNIYEQRVAQTLDLKGVEPGDTALLPVDEAYSYVGLTGLARQAFVGAYGKVKLTLPAEKIRLYEDHFAHATFPEIGELTRNQRSFAEELGLPEGNYFKGKRSEGGGKGICHRERIENLDPGASRVIIATDSHTPTIGALPVLGIPVGSTLFAAALAEGKLPYCVNKVMRVELIGGLPDGVNIRDAQLEMARGIKSGDGIGVVEFGGDGLDNLAFDQVVALCNMVPEVFNAEVAVTEAFAAGIKYLTERWGVSKRQAAKMYGKPQPGCHYARIIKYDLGGSSPWIAGPGSPNNALPLSAIKVNPHVDKAYLVSCTVGAQDMRDAAQVLKKRQVAKGTRLIVVASSDKIREELEQDGTLTILRKSGAEVVNESACGACIGAGLGAVEKGEIAITASNRNFPGRMGDKSAFVYMGGAPLTAVAAVLGHIPTAKEYKELTSVKY